MNETIHNIVNRRSIRAYKEEQIEEDELQCILRAGMYSPSAMNQQPWHFTVVQNKDILEMLNTICKNYLMFFSKFSDKKIQQKIDIKNHHVYFHAPTMIIISGDTKANSPHIDCAAALENMLIAASSMNIGSCWITATAHLFKTKRGDSLKKELNIPKEYMPLYSAVFGYKHSEPPKVIPRKKNVVNYLR